MPHNDARITPAKLNAVDPLAWLADVFARIAVLPQIVCTSFFHGSGSSAAPNPRRLRKANHCPTTARAQPIAPRCSAKAYDLRVAKGKPAPAGSWPGPSKSAPEAIGESKGTHAVIREVVATFLTVARFGTASGLFRPVPFRWYRPYLSLGVLS